MKSNSIKALTATVAALAFSVAAHAVPLAGSVEYNLDDTEFSFNSSSVDFVGETNGKVNNADGDFAGLIDTDVVHSDFAYDPFSGPIDPFVVAGAFSYALDTITFFDYLSFGNVSILNIVGEGMVSMAGYDDTWATLTFTASENTSPVAAASNYSATITTAPASVADGGTTLASLGFAIVALAVASRARARSGKTSLAA